LFHVQQRETALYFRKKTLHFYNNLNNKYPITIILAHSVIRPCVLKRLFHIQPHLSSATVLPWEITQHKK